MPKISDVKILYKILACFVLLGLVVGGAIWFATSKMKEIDGAYAKILDHEVQAMKAGIRVNVRVYNFGRLSWRLIAETESADMNKTIEEIGANHKEFITQIDLAKKNAPNFAARFEQARQIFDAIMKDHVAIEKVALADNNEEALRLAKAMIPRTNELRNFLVEATEALDKAMQTASDDATAETNRTIVITTAAIGLALALVFMLAFGLVQFGIARPLAGLVGALKKLAGGDFEVALPGLGRKDEVGAIAGTVEEFKRKLEEKMRLEAEKEQEIARREQAERDERARQEAENARIVANVVAALGAGLENLARGNLTYRIDDEFVEQYKKVRDDFNAAIGQLQETIRNIALSTNEVSNAASEISTSTSDLSQRTEEQAASLEETSASMEQMAVTVKKNAENAQQANQFATETAAVADRGGAVVTQAISAMSRIEESSRKISDIISVIDEIARQTNLLALNAAVEAARAGEAGRGFAVVASEVRSLAQRSSQAAKDIKDLITNSSTQVQEGVDLVNRAGASLTEIVESIKKVAQIVSDIAVASNQQSTGIDQINTALNQMDEVTQQNSALVEENAATAKTLEQQSGAMTENVGSFRLGSDAAAGAKTAKRPFEHGREKMTPVRRPAAAARRPRTQGALALAEENADWKEF